MQKATMPIWVPPTKKTLGKGIYTIIHKIYHITAVLVQRIINLVNFHQVQFLPIVFNSFYILFTSTALIS